MSVFFLRHGQAFHNTPECKALPTCPGVSPLTVLGKEQAQAANVPPLVVEVWVSPAQRAIETALLAGLDKYPMHLKHELSEVDNNHIFKMNGSDPETMEKYSSKFQSVDYPVDLLCLDKNLEQALWRRDMTRLELFKWTEKNPGKVLVVVAHLKIFQLLAKRDGFWIGTGQCVEVDLFKG